MIKSTSLDVENAQAIFKSSIGSEKIYCRDYNDNLVYTQGVMDIQKQLNAFWLVDLVISHMPTVLKDFEKTEDTFYVVSIIVDSSQGGIFEIYREGYEGDTYNEHISVVTQEIPYVDLPCGDTDTEYKLFLELANYSPVQFMLLQTTEH